MVDLWKENKAIDRRIHRPKQAQAKQHRFSILRSYQDHNLVFFGIIPGHEAVLSKQKQTIPSLICENHRPPPSNANLTQDRKIQYMQLS